MSAKTTALTGFSAVRKLCASFGRLGTLRFRRFAPHPRLTASDVMCNSLRRRKHYKVVQSK